MKTYDKNFEEIFHFAVFGMDTRDYAFQIWKSLGNLGELLFECRMVQQILNSVQTDLKDKYVMNGKQVVGTYRALISETSRRGMHNQMRKSRLPGEMSLGREQALPENNTPKGVIHRESSFSKDPSSVPSLFSSTWTKKRVHISRNTKYTKWQATNLNVSQTLSVQHKALTSLHRIVNIEILHAQNILINIQLAKVPVHVSGMSTLSMTMRTDQIMAPSASMAPLQQTISRILCGTAPPISSSSSSSSMLSCSSAGYIALSSVSV
jgi:hypothetical protein